jgi:hypothetical protein|uniref:Minor tail protein n=1 Tax=Siphoviridae sp. ctqpo8 TaxID=2826469 RepID=A0A8S5M349_9CAUD|nr:MAG TPA: minor tail protein [Siphoviridae sp. ctqpo8]
MAKKIAELLIKLGADTYGFKAMSGEVKKQLAGLSKDLQGFGKSMSLYFTAPLTAAAGASVHLADVQMQAEQRLLTALKGRESVQKRLIKQAGELQSRSIFGDEVIIGQQAFLASLGLTEQQINDTIEASAQLSAATGMTLDSAVKNLAKTYGGLTGELGKSIPALKQFTAEELKNGAAVQFALDNYKGFAETVARTGLGPLQQLKNSLGDLGEEIGMVLMPVVREIVGWFQKAETWLQELPSGTKTAIVAVGGLVAAIGPLSIALGAILKMLPLIKPALSVAFGPVGIIVATATALFGALVAWRQGAVDAADAQRELNRITSETETKIAAERYEIDQLFGRLEAATEGTQEYADAKQTILDKYGTYLSKLGDEETALNDVAAAYRAVTQGAERAARARAMDAALQSTADTYAKQQSRTYDAIKETFEKRLKGQKTSSGVDMAAYALAKIRPVVMEGAEIDAETRGIINKVTDHINGAEWNIVDYLLKRLQVEKAKADKAVSDLMLKWGSQAESGSGTIADENDDDGKTGNIKIEKTIGLIGQLQEKISQLEDAKKKATNTYEIANLNKELEQTRLKLEGLQNTGQLGSIVKNRNGLMDKPITPLQFDPNAINPPAADWEAAAEKFRQNLGNMKNTVQGAIMDYGAMLNNLVQDLAFAFGEGLGNILSGDGAFDDLAAGFGRAVGQFLVSLGKQLIATSEVIESIKVALNSIWATPWVGLVVGAAAIAAGTAMISAFKSNASKGIALANGGLAYGPTMALVGDNRGAGSDPEVIAPLSKLRQYGFGRQSLEFVGGQFRVSGSDLLLAIRREDVRVNYVNAGV